MTSKTAWFKRISQFLSKEPKNKKQFLAVLRKALQHQFLNVDSLSMIEGVLHISEMEASEVMVPRSEMVILKKEMTLNEILPIIIDSSYARFPVIGDTKDEIIGILHAKDLFMYYNSELKFSLKEIIRPAVFIPESKRLDLLLKEFKTNRNHMAIVVDEYGNITGLVTIENVLEQIVGAIEDEHDIDETVTIKKHTKNNFSVQALTPLAEFNDYFNTHFSDEEVDTIGGFVLQGFGHLPTRGESITLEDLEFTVLKANERRIRLLGVRLKKKTDAEKK